MSAQSITNAIQWQGICQRNVLSARSQLDQAEAALETANAHIDRLLGETPLDDPGLNRLAADLIDFPSENGSHDGIENGGMA